MKIIFSFKPVNDSLRIILKGYFLEKTFNVNNQTHLDDFYKVIPPLNLTKKSEYIVIDDLIEYR